jgi:fermentation-respiration switch protein FrsA (DUF1100 family)
MAVEERASQREPFPLGRYALVATAATLGVSGAAAAVASAVAGLLVYQFARPRPSWGTDDPPDGAAEEVTFLSADNDVRLSGWFFPSAAGAPTVVLCHGVWTGRRECLPLALRFQRAGYNVLCFDFRAHGLSDGRYISVGHHETNDVIGAVRYLRTRSEVDRDRIGVVGFSMGAVATIQAAARCADIAAVVADSAYATFAEAARYSFREVVFGLPHYPFAPMAMRWAKWIVHVDPTQLRPIDHIGRIAPRPILITHGTHDEVVPVRHAEWLFKAAEEPKELWLVPQVGHVGARDTQPDEYFDRIEAFLRTALADPVRPTVRLANAA